MNMESEPVRVSILEREALLRECLSRLLLRAGMRVVADQAEPNGFLRYLASHRPDVALLDFPLPAEAVLELLRLARLRQPGLPLLVVRGSEEEGAAELFLRAGAAGFLDRASAGYEALLSAVRAAARGERLVTSSAMELRPPPEAEEPTLLRSLTLREREVLSWVASGADNLKIAALLGITERTVKAHVSNLYRKLGQKNRTQMALFAEQLGVRPPATH